MNRPELFTISSKPQLYHHFQTIGEFLFKKAFRIRATVFYFESTLFDSLFNYRVYNL